MNIFAKRRDSDLGNLSSKPVEGDYEGLCLTQIRERKYQHGFSLIELLVVIGVIAILASLLLPALARSKESGRRIGCVNNLRQMALSMSLYADDHDGKLPPRSRDVAWRNQLKSYYKDSRILICPSDSTRRSDSGEGDNASTTEKRSYILNGFEDYFATVQPPEDFKRYTKGLWPEGLSYSLLAQRPDAIVFAEKVSTSDEEFIQLNTIRPNYIEAVEQSRHGSARNKSGGSSEGNYSGLSNYTRPDGSVTGLRSGHVYCPENLCAITDYGRTNFAVCVSP